MAKVKTFIAEYGMSVQIKDIWHKFGCRVETELEPEDELNEVKEKTWNTVILEVEKQFRAVLTENKY